MSVRRALLDNEAVERIFAAPGERFFKRHHYRPVLPTAEKLEKWEDASEWVEAVAHLQAAAASFFGWREIKRAPPWERKKELLKLLYMLDKAGMQFAKPATQKQRDAHAQRIERQFEPMKEWRSRRLSPNQFKMLAKVCGALRNEDCESKESERITSAARNEVKKELEKAAFDIERRRGGLTPNTNRRKKERIPDTNRRMENCIPAVERRRANPIPKSQKSPNLHALIIALWHIWVDFFQGAPGVSYGHPDSDQDGDVIGPYYRFVSQTLDELSSINETLDPRNDDDAETLTCTPDALRYHIRQARRREFWPYLQ